MANRQRVNAPGDATFAPEDVALRKDTLSLQLNVNFITLAE